MGKNEVHLEQLLTEQAKFKLHFDEAVIFLESRLADIDAKQSNFLVAIGKSQAQVDAILLAVNSLGPRLSAECQDLEPTATSELSVSPIACVNGESESPEIIRASDEECHQSDYDPDTKRQLFQIGAEVAPIANLVSLSAGQSEESEDSAHDEQPRVQLPLEVISEDDARGWTSTGGRAVVHSNHLDAPGADEKVSHGWTSAGGCEHSDSKVADPAIEDHHHDPAPVSAHQRRLAKFCYVQHDPVGMLRVLSALPQQGAEAFMDKHHLPEFDTFDPWSGSCHQKTAKEKTT